MVAPEPQITTRLQSRIDAQDEKIASIATDVHNLSASITSMQEILKELPAALAKLANQPPPYHDGGDFSGSGVFDTSGNPLHSDLRQYVKNNHFESSLFSMPKVKLPVFEGVDPRGWITKAELYFQVHKTSSSQKLNLTQMCMDGSALNWFTNLMFKHPQTTWDQFREKLMVRFGGTKFYNAHEALGSLYQEGDIDEYIERFEALSALIPDQSEDQSVGMFLRGLQPDIKNWVRALHPRSCDQAMELARHVAIATDIHGDKTNTKGKTSFNIGVNSNNHNDFLKYSPLDKANTPNLYQSSRPNYPITQAQPKPYEPSNTNRNLGTRHLSKQEWEDRRKRGLCFGCGEKYSPQHKCAEGQLRVILLTDGEEMGVDGEIYRVEAGLEDEQGADGECNTLELYDFASGSPALRTFKLMGEIRGIPALILVDGGATHNFISRQLALALGLEIRQTKPLSIYFGGTSNRFRIFEVCQGVSIQLGTYTCIVDALVYDLGPLDMILGIAWLGTLGDVVSNWQTQQMRFWKDGTLIELQGVSSSPYGQLLLETRPIDIQDTTGLMNNQLIQLGTMALQRLPGRMHFKLGSLISGLRTSLLFKTAALIGNGPPAH